MKRLALISTCLMLLVPMALAQDVLVQWEFNTDGDAEGWFPAHSLAPFVVQGGVLKTTVTDGDPYMHASSGQSFDLECNDFQYIEVRMRHDSGESAEFFWADTTAGADAGFVGGKERGFPCVPDNEWHTYHVYPLWQGRVSRLRLDPPGEGSIEIDHVRVVQGQRSEHDAASPSWDLTAGAGGWIAAAGGTHIACSPRGTSTTLTAERAVLIGPAVSLSAADYRYAYVQLEATRPVTGGLYWSSTDDGNFAACNMASFDAPAGSLAINLPLATNPMFAGEVKRLQLAFDGEAGTTVTLKRLELSAKPLGPAALRLVSFAARDALTTLGQTGLLVASVENRGGEELRDARLTARVASGKATLTGVASIAIPRLAPGATARVTWTYEATAEGPAAFVLEGPEGLQARTDIVASRPFPTLAASATPRAGVSDQAAWLGNDRVRLTLVRGEEGFARGRLDAMEGGKARPMAVLPSLASLSVAGSEGMVSLAATQARASGDEARATLTLTGQTTVGPARVTLRVDLALKKGKSYIEARYELSADRDLAIGAFRGPWLWAGEGSFGDEQDLALFPGSEYLVAGERSSSTLDIAPPRNVRFAPHPNTVTVPSMAIEKDGAIVGLMWDPLQRWDGEHQKPTAVFASPNFVEGHANHLLGLYLPSVPDWVEPNELAATTPYELKAGGKLTLQAAMYAEAPSEVLRCVDLYLDRYGVPALPPKARSYEDTVALSLRCYEDVLWVESAKGWMGVIGWAPGRSQGVALSYLVDSRRLAERDFAAGLQQKGLELADRGDLGFALHHFGSPCRSLADRVAAGRIEASLAPADGGYAFMPAESRLEALGQRGSTAVGICAREVRSLLQTALLTGDAEPLQAGLRTLKFMERFKVPRASQVWEVPVHTPDILASANACEAYLMGYKLTGDRALLERAVYWARTGVPFVYLWQAPEQRDLMKGGSIAVFGASFYTGSWFARPVQWNGLEWARVLLDLARCDDTLPWRHFAEMVTISGINQQSTREADRGTYTDNWDVIKDIECTVCMLAPGRIMTNSLDLLGVPTGTRTEVVLCEGKPVSITAAQLVSDARVSGDRLELSLRYDAGYTSYTVIMPMAEPRVVLVDGQPLARCAEPVEEDEGWSYDEGPGCVTLKLRYGAEARRVSLSPVRPIKSELRPPGWEFDAEGNAEGWTPAHDVDPLEVREGKLIVTVTGPDPYIASPRMSAPAAEYPEVVFRVRVTKPGGQLFFANARGGFAPERSRSFEVPADGQFHEVRLDMSDHAEWTGLVNQIRLDFGSAPCTAELEWVRLVKPGE